MEEINGVRFEIKHSEITGDKGETLNTLVYYPDLNIEVSVPHFMETSIEKIKGNICNRFLSEKAYIDAKIKNEELLKQLNS